MQSCNDKKVPKIDHKPDALLEEFHDLPFCIPTIWRTYLDECGDDMKRAIQQLGSENIIWQILLTCVWIDLKKLFCGFYEIKKKKMHLGI